MQYLEIAARCRQAAGIVGQGWCQVGLAANADGSVSMDTDTAPNVCFRGALYRICDAAGLSNYAVDEIEMFAEPFLGGEHVPCYNDATERTQAEVVAKLHEIADAAERKAVEVGEVPEPPIVVIRKPEAVMA